MTVDSPGDAPEGLPEGALFLSPEPDSIKRARQFTSAVLAGEEWTEARDVAVLLVSELVTNAVLHSASPVELTISVDRQDSPHSAAGGSGGAVPGTLSATVRVTDADTGPILTRASAERLSEGGRGIFLVDRLAGAWGTEHAKGRKTVWFSVPAPVLDATRARRPAPNSGPDVELDERRMTALVLAPELEGTLSATEQLTELLARIVTALDANGASMESRSLDEGITTGRQEGIRSEVPLALGGQAHGRLAVFAPRDLDDDSLAFLRLAGQRLAVSLAANSLVSAARDRQAAQEFLSQATELLAGSSTLDHTLSLAAQMVVPTLAEWCVAYAVDDRNVPRVVTAMHAEEVRLDSVLAYAETDEAVGDLVGGATRSLQVTSGRGVVSGTRYHLLAVPLVSRREPSGLLLLGTKAPLDPPSYVAMIELGRRVSLSAENARLHGQVADAAIALQASLLPSALPQLPGLLLGARYRASSPALAVGGDFYDAFALPDGSAILMIGDVCGRGAEAAAVTRTTRDLLRLMLIEGWTLSSALRRLNQMLLDELSADRFCTVAVARIAPGGRSGRAQGCVCLAGHPEPVLLRAGGATELVGRTGGLLGILPDDLLGLEEAEFELEPGDDLILYTDGVTEARRDSEMFGQTGMTAVLQTLGPASPQAVAEAIEAAAARFTGNTLRDDMAILVAQLTADG